MVPFYEPGDFQVIGRIGFAPARSGASSVQRVIYQRAKAIDGHKSRERRRAIVDIDGGGSLDAQGVRPRAVQKNARLNRRPIKVARETISIKSQRSSIVSEGRTCICQITPGFLGLVQLVMHFPEAA